MMTPNLHLHMNAQVTLVGAGPGDPELLTLKAVRAISRATVIFIDDLANPAVLAHASPRARIINVGKRGGCVSTPQSFIEKLMILAVRDGEQVVRLKGGDPFIFGRGGEEVDNLRAHGIAVEVINGITSGLAASTALGIPLTHREHAHGVILVTGHNRPGDPQTDWTSLAQTVQQCQLTLVIYMGITNVSSITNELGKALPGSTPAAVIQGATLPCQQQIICTLNTLVDTIRHEKIVSPAIIVIGSVVQAAQMNRLQINVPAKIAA